MGSLNNPPLNVGVSNPGGDLYIRGSEFVDGSIRFILINDRSVIQKRENGVWNSAEFEVGENSLFLGSNLSLGGIGENVEIRSVEGDKRFLLLDTKVLDSDTEHAKVPVAGQLITRLLLQPDNTVDALLTSHTRETTVIPQTAGFGFRFYFEVGDTAPIGECTVSLTLGHTPGGAVLFRRTFPASEFPSNTEVSLDTGGLGLQAGELALITVSSDTAFSLKGNAAGDFFFGLDFQPITHEDLVSENSIFGNNLDHVLDLTLDPIYTTPVFS